MAKDLKKNQQIQSATIAMEILIFEDGTKEFIIRTPDGRPTHRFYEPMEVAEFLTELTNQPETKDEGQN